MIVEIDDRDEGEAERHQQRVEQLVVAEQRGVPVEREALPHEVPLRVVEEKMIRTTIGANRNA